MVSKSTVCSLAPSVLFPKAVSLFCPLRTFSAVSPPSAHVNFAYRQQKASEVFICGREEEKGGGGGDGGLLESQPRTHLLLWQRSCGPASLDAPLCHIEKTGGLSGSSLCFSAPEGSPERETTSPEEPRRVGCRAGEGEARENLGAQLPSAPLFQRS